MNSLGNDNRIEIFENLDDPGQPYTCTQWGELGQDNIPVIVEPNYQYQIWEWFSIESYFGMIVILDPNMVYRYYGSNISEIYSTVEDILSETTWITGDINFDEAIDILDVILIVNSILNSNYNYYSDLNQDQIVNIQDIIILIAIILGD